MISGLHYIIEWVTARHNLVITATIKDNAVQIPDTDQPERIFLRGTGDPLHITTINHSRDKLRPIRAKQATLQFVATNDVSITNFAFGTDFQFPVEITVNESVAGTRTLFIGYLALHDLQQPLLPVATVELMAIDNLGLLREVPFTDTEGNNPVGHNKISYYLANALLKTGLSLPIHVQNNIRHGTGAYTAEVDFSGNTVALPAETRFFYPGQRIRITGTASNNGNYNVTGDLSTLGVSSVDFEESFTTEANVTATFQDISSEVHLYDFIYLEAKTFEKEIGESESCWEVIEKILGEDCYLSQYNGCWYINRVDEFDGNPSYYGVYDSDGTFSTFDVTQQYLKNIGADEDTKWIQASCMLYPVNRTGSLKETYNYNTPAEVPENVNLERGTGSDPVGVGEETIDYTPAAWEYLRVSGATNADIDRTPFAGSLGVLRKEFVDGYQKERYLNTETAGGFVHYFKSKGIPVHEGDKIDLSVEVLAPPADNAFPVHVRLVGDDGSFWDWKNDPGNGINEWSDNSPSSNGWFQYPWRLEDSDGENSQTLSAESKKIPVDGVIYIRLVNGFNAGNPVRFNSIGFQYIPKINGSYSRYSGQYSKNETTEEDIAAKREKEVYITDSPKKLFKGGLFRPTIGRELYSGSIQFGVNGFVLSGDVRGTYRVGDHVYISSVSYNGHAKIETVTYNLIGGTTAIEVSGLNLSIVTESGSISETSFVSSHLFYTAHAFSLGNPPDLDRCKLYSRQQVDAVWNQYRNNNSLVDGMVYGFTAEWPDLVYKFSLTDSHPTLRDRYFILLGMDQDWKSCEMRATLIEVYETNRGKVYDDPFSFKYISENE